MRKSIPALIRSTLGITTNVPNPIQWKITAKKISYNIYEIHMIAFITHPWRLYAQESALEGPLPTIIKFEENAFVSIIGKPKEIGTVKEDYEEVFKVITHFYTIAVDFVQEVKVYKQPELIIGTIIYMACTENKCLKPKEIQFQIELTQKSVRSFFAQ